MFVIAAQLYINKRRAHNLKNVWRQKTTCMMGNEKISFELVKGFIKERNYKSKDIEPYYGKP